MEIEIVSKKENKLLERIEINGLIKYESNVPTRNDVRSHLAKLFECDEDLVIVKKIEPKYGLHEAKLEANIYKDSSLIKKLENLKKKSIKAQVEKKEEKKEEESKVKSDKEENKEEKEENKENKDVKEEQNKQKENKEKN